MCAKPNHKELQQTEQCPDSRSAMVTNMVIATAGSGDDDVCYHHGESLPRAWEGTRKLC